MLLFTIIALLAISYFGYKYFAPKETEVEYTSEADDILSAPYNGSSGIGYTSGVLAGDLSTVTGKTTPPAEIVSGENNVVQPTVAVVTPTTDSTPAPPTSGV